MIAIKKQTAEPPVGRPVKFYKYVALTFLLITIVLFGVIIFMSSKRTTITITAKAEPVDISRSIEVGGDKLNSLSGTVASTTVSLSKKFQVTGGREEEAVAEGAATIHNESSYNQPLVATTRLLTAGGVLFRLKDRVLVPAGGTIEVEVYADKPGKESEIGPSRFTIPGLSEPKQKLIYATSDGPMTGGIRTVGVLSSADLKKAKDELLLELESQGRQDLKASLPEILSGREAIYKVIDSSFEADAEVGDEVAGFTVSASALVVGVFYNKEEVSQLMNQELNKHLIGDTELIYPSSELPAVKLAEFDLTKGMAGLDIFHSGRVSLNPESKQLDKIIFYGKTKEEVRRYLLSLDHVHGVEIKFSPVWMRTVPYVAEHVNVVVKSVE